MASIYIFTYIYNFNCFIKKIVNHPKKVIYQNKTYDYEIEEVSDDYYMDNNINYKMLTIKGDYKTEDKIINLKFIKGKTQILMQIIKMIKGGIV